MFHPDSIEQRENDRVRFRETDALFRCLSELSPPGVHRLSERATGLRRPGLGGTPKLKAS